MSPVPVRELSLDRLKLWLDECVATNATPIALIAVGQAGDLHVFRTHNGPSDEDLGALIGPSRHPTHARRLMDALLDDEALTKALTAFREMVERIDPQSLSPEDVVALRALQTKLWELVA